MSKQSDSMTTAQSVCLAAVIIAIIAAAVALAIAGDGVWVIWFIIILGLIFF